MTWQPEQIRTEDDGLTCPNVGRWAEDKYRLLSLYDRLFSTGMKNKWEQRVYIDLYAGAGYSRIRGTEIVLRGSPILALTVADPFDKYIFCEEQPERLAALKERAKRAAPYANISFVAGSCNDRVDEIRRICPTALISKSCSLVVFCGSVRLWDEICHYTQAFVRLH
ncbi:MAG: three-Cys-motif partner protein TcmP [Acidobacteriaceae bacterium]